MPWARASKRSNSAESLFPLAHAPLLQALEEGGAGHRPSRFAARSLGLPQRRKVFSMSWRSTCCILCSSVPTR
jgi:hypothetical protein